MVFESAEIGTASLVWLRDVIRRSEKTARQDAKESSQSKNLDQRWSWDKK
jgi:hypothetical protein